MTSAIGAPASLVPLLAVILGPLSPDARAQAPAKATATFQIRVDRGHAWRPPFGLDRVGRPTAVVIDSTAQPGPAAYRLGLFAKGKEVSRLNVQFPKTPPFSVRQDLDSVVWADEIVLTRHSPGEEKSIELARQTLDWPKFEADASARPSSVINPVDLGTVLVPEGWLLLGPGQSVKLDFAAMCRDPELTVVRVKSWFGSDRAHALDTRLNLRVGEKRHVADLGLLNVPSAGDRDILSIVVDLPAGGTLWRKDIPVMLVRDPPRQPRFGATYERLRYDAPISVREGTTGKYSSMRYEDGWKSELRDVVVWLPNGGRFVFWRGSSYIPFWAGLHNTAACYEWAEIISQPKGAVDCVEPLMDKELRYGSVEIVESSASRVHVRWRYQSTDFLYKIWGDQAEEDYYFYPDGFGTRVVTLKSDPQNDYELSEFIIISPQGAYPLEVLPDAAIDALYLNGKKHHFRFPNSSAPDPAARDRDRENVPPLFRFHFGKKETLAAIYFSPNETRLPGVVFAPFFDAGQMVTPCYWGSHWPLARGNSTGNKIDDRIQFTPTHSSVMSWAGRRPEPLSTASRFTLDTLGRSRMMSVRRWSWLIGTSDAADDRLVAWAQSFAAPPSLELKGARLDFGGYASERRAICLEAFSSDIRITIKPSGRCVNPVFELAHAPPGNPRIMFAGEQLAASRFAWDGRTLWLDATIEAPTELRVTFDAPQGRFH